jgi:anti-sigma B factor antagonist
MELLISALDKTKGQYAMPIRGADGDRLRVRVEAEAAATVVHLIGDLDFRTAEVLRQVVDVRLAAGQVRLVFDCTELVFCDSSGLGVMVGAAKRANAQGGGVSLRAVPGHLRQVLILTGLAKVLRIDPTEQDPESNGN